MAEEIINTIEEVEEVKTQEESVKTYTQEEMDRLLQSESDKRVTQARAKFEEDFKVKLEAEKSEAVKLASLSEEERYKAELAKEREAFERERATFRKSQLEAETIKQLSSNNLPIEFSSYLLADDAETIKNNIASFSEQWTSAIQNEVHNRLKGSTPQSSNRQAGTITKEQFNKLSLDEKMNLYEDNPELYKQLK